MAGSIRELGSVGKYPRVTQQFAEGTTVDGDRLDLSMDDLVMSVNSIPPKWMRRRFTHTQFVQRLMPVGYGVGLSLVQDPPPFLLIRNIITQIVGVAPANGLQNEWRLKGTDIEAIPQNNYATGTEGIYSWTSAHYFRSPTIITGLSLRCWQPTAYAWDNDWQYHTDAPPGKVNNQPVDDLFLELSVDNPFSTEVRRLNDIELHKIRFPVNTETMASALAAPANNLTVPLIAIKPDQLWVHLDNLCIPLHADTRLRASIAIPQYADADGDVSGWGSDGVSTWKPWQSTSWALTMTVLEPVEGP
jgi:hypothetical protein